MSSSPAAVPVETSAPTGPARWSLPHRIGFRFVFALVALWLDALPSTTLPAFEWLSNAMFAAWNAVTVATGRLLLGRTVDVGMNGSGDTSAKWVGLALHVLIAIVATAAWSLIDRRRDNYLRLRRWLLTWMRFSVGTTMVAYGFGKLFYLQFSFPSAGTLDQPYGDASPMGLLWTFMGYSHAYNIFTGLAETVPALLLFFRRTAVLGALMLVAVLANVVLLNFCYDVPVKIFSTQLLLASLYIAAPRLRALFDLLVRQRAVAAAPVEPLFARPKLDRAARIVGLLLVGFILVDGAWMYLKLPRRGPSATTGPLVGNWIVDEETRDGATVAPNEDTRWANAVIEADGTFAQVRYRRLDGFYDRVRFALDTTKKTLTTRAEPKTVWGYAQDDADHLTLTGVLDGKSRQLKLHRDPRKREWRLLTRGFHWVNEVPFNR